MLTPWRWICGVALGLVLSVGSLAEATIIITPTSQVQWFFSGSNNPDADDLEAFFNGAGDVPAYNLGGDELTSAYKANVGTVQNPAVVEEGPYAPNYTTVFSNTATDPEDADITWDGGFAIDFEHMFLVVKDGNEGTYVFDLNNINGVSWDGMEEIELREFWAEPPQGAISHIEIFVGGDGPDQGPLLPEPTSIVAWLLGAGGLGLILRRRMKKADA